MLILRRCCCTSGYLLTITVGGCNGIAQPGAAVAVYTSSGGSLIASGTTDSLGQVTLDIGAPGTYWFTASGNARFAAYAASRTVLGSTILLQLAPASGYYCLVNCGLPLKDTLVATWISGGDSSLPGTTWSLVNIGSGWTGISAPGGESVTLTIAATGQMTLDSGSIFGNCHLSLSGPLSLACPPSFSASYTSPSSPPSPQCTTAPPLGHDFTGGGLVDVTE